MQHPINLETLARIIKVAKPDLIGIYRPCSDDGVYVYATPGKKAFICAADGASAPSGNRCEIIAILEPAFIQHALNYDPTFRYKWTLTTNFLEDMLASDSEGWSKRATFTDSHRYATTDKQLEHVIDPR